MHSGGAAVAAEKVSPIHADATQAAMPVSAPPFIINERTELLQQQARYSIACPCAVVTLQTIESPRLQGCTLSEMERRVR
jgi:hypothetical protein